MKPEENKEQSGRDQHGKFTEGNRFSPGRKPNYKNPEELAQKIYEYYNYIEGEYIMKPGERHSKTKNPDGSVTETTETYEYKEWVRNPETPSMTGMAIFLGFESRQSLYDYAKKSRFSYIIKRGLLEIEKVYESGLWQDKPIGAIFALKNMGWSDKTETDITSKGEKLESTPSAVKVEIVRPNFDD